jgi:hypothetical protein
MSKKLQSIKFDIQEAKGMILDVMSVLNDRRVDFGHFDRVLESACETMEILNVTLVQPRHSKVQVNRANPPASSPSEYYRRAIYLPLVDSITVDLRSRFSDETLNKLSELSTLIPASIVQTDGHESLDVAAHLMRMFSTVVEGDSASACQFKLNGEINFWRQKWVRQSTAKPKESIPETVAEGLSACDKETFPLVHLFLTILFTLPLSTASAERSFSTLRRLKTWLRSRMGEERLTGLALLHIHRDIDVNVDNVIDRFGKSKSKKRRHLDFVI